MVVTSADVAVGGQLSALTPHDDAKLGVRLKLDEAVNNVDSRVFQIARPADVGRLIKARL